MIKREELMPLIEPFMNDENSADIVESINAIDVYEGSDKSEWEQEMQAALDENNKKWNERFRKAFFGGKNEAATVLDGETAGGNTQYVAPDEVKEESFTIDDLLYKKED